MRRKRQPRSRASARQRRVMPVPGTPYRSMWPPARRHVIASVLTRSCPRITRSSCCRSTPTRVEISLMLCIEPPKSIVDALQRRPAAHQFRHTFLQRVAAQSGLRCHGPRERFLIERESFGVGHRFLIQRAERRHEIDSFRSRVAKFFFRRTDPRGTAPQLQNRDAEGQEKEWAETPIFEEIERPGRARQSLRVL